MPISVKAPGREHPIGGTPNRLMYPWADLSVGDWFFIEHDFNSPLLSNRGQSMIQGKIGALIRDRKKEGDKHKYMHFRADQDGKSGVKVLRLK